MKEVFELVVVILKALGMGFLGILLTLGWLSLLSLLP